MKQGYVIHNMNKLLLVPLERKLKHQLKTYNFKENDDLINSISIPDEQERIIKVKAGIHKTLLIYRKFANDISQ